MADIDFGQISEALNDKTDRDMRNVDTTAGADAVIEYQEPTSANNYTWYRKYKSGWVEQGGLVNNNTAIKTVTLPVTMGDTNYNILCTTYYPTSDQTLYQPHVSTLTTTSFKVASYGERGSGTNTNGAPTFWQVSGISAN